MFQTCPRGVKRQLSTLVVIMELLTLSKRMPEHVKDITELHKLGKWMGFFPVASGAEVTQIIQVLQNCLEPEPRSKDLKIPQLRLLRLNTAHHS